MAAWPSSPPVSRTPEPRQCPRRQRHHSHDHTRTRLRLKLRAEEAERNLVRGSCDRTPNPDPGHGIVEKWLDEVGRRTHHAESRLSNDACSQTRAPGQDWIARRYSRMENDVAPVVRPGSSYQRRGSKKRKRLGKSEDSLISEHDDGYHRHSNLQRTSSGLGQAADYNGVSRAVSEPEDGFQFEKRLRHKTRDNKYDKQGNRRDRSEAAHRHEEVRPRKDRRTKKTRHIHSGRDIMKTYSSDTILTNRITVQPVLQPGLFKNGRTSDRKPLADLAFSNMQFLGHYGDEPRPPAPSKSRRNEKRREARELEEVSSFFDRSRGTKLDGGANHASVTEADHKKSESTTNHLNTSNSRKHSLSTMDTTGMTSRSSDHVKKSSSFPCPKKKQREAEADPLVNNEAPRSARARSSTDTTYFSFSDGQISSTTGSAKTPNAQVDPLYGSQTPESIRNALRKTRIYRHTGIYPLDDMAPEPQAHGNTTETSCNRVADSDGNFVADAEESRRSPMPNDGDADDGIAEGISLLEKRWRAILKSPTNQEKNLVSEHTGNFESSQPSFEVPNSCPTNSMEGVARYVASEATQNLGLPSNTRRGFPNSSNHLDAYQRSRKAADTPPGTKHAEISTFNDCATPMDGASSSGQEIRPPPLPLIDSQERERASVDRKGVPVNSKTDTKNEGHVDWENAPLELPVGDHDYERQHDLLRQRENPRIESPCASIQPAVWARKIEGPSLWPVQPDLTYPEATLQCMGSSNQLDGNEVLTETQSFVPHVRKRIFPYIAGAETEAIISNQGAFHDTRPFEAVDRTGLQPEKSILIGSDFGWGAELAQHRTYSTIQNQSSEYYNQSVITGNQHSIVREDSIGPVHEKIEVPDFEDERNEMSLFWRPNHFCHF